jgi:hypothetical protein
MADPATLMALPPATRHVFARTVAKYTASSAIAMTIVTEIAAETVFAVTTPSSHTTSRNAASMTVGLAPTVTGS